MYLSEIELRALRNITHCKLSLAPHLNILHGANGAGKSSFLEGVYLLGYGRSFRTTRYTRVVQEGADRLTAFGLLVAGKAEPDVPRGTLPEPESNPEPPEAQARRAVPIGIARSRNGDVSIRVNREDQKQLSVLPALMPVQLLSPENYQLLSEAPGSRRRFLDWGVFHVEHRFLFHWRRMNRSLAQRNRALKNAGSYQDIEPWDKELVDSSQAIGRMRRDYLAVLNPYFQRLLEQFLPDIPLELVYAQGWPEAGDLADVLAEAFQSDRKSGFTRAGPQKADVRVTLRGKTAHEQLSRGQQKLAVHALKLAQLVCLQEQTGKSGILLVDDIGAELDKAHQQVLFQTLADMSDLQIFVTSVNLEPLKPLIKRYNGAHVFHVEQGEISPQFQEK